MADIQTSLIPALNRKLLGYQDAFAPAGTVKATENDARKVSALNEGQHHLWRLLVSLGRDTLSYWYVKKASATAATTVKSIALPSDFHALLFVEATTAGWQKVHFKQRGFDVAEFENARRTNTADFSSAPDEVFCMVARNPALADGGTLEFSGSFPGVSLNLIYQWKLGEWTAKTDNIDHIPEGFRPLVISYAARELLRSVHREDLASNEDSLLKQLREETIAAASQGLPSTSAMGSETYGMLPND